MTRICHECPFAEAIVDPPSVMTIDELAAYLNVAKSTLYKLAQEGKVPGQKVGKHWRFHKDAVDNWLASRATEKRG